MYYTEILFSVNMTNIVDKKTEQYYDDAQILYNLFWSDKAVHYGFWNHKTKRLSDALENTNRFVSKLLNLQENDYVLDAGCGVGGSSFSIAGKFGVKVKRITLSNKQIKQAKRNARKLHLDDLVSFEIMDLNKTRFKDKTFTKIFGIESVCYSCSKPAFLKEAYRLLRPDGRIVVVDGFLTKRDLTQKEDEIYNKCLLGWKVPSLSHKDDFLDDLRKAGFKNIGFDDKTDEVIPSSRRITFYGYLFFPLSFILGKLRLISKNLHENSVAMINQRKTFHNFTVYGVFVAEK